jgi:DNA-binding response OmpR family regulator
MMDHAGGSGDSTQNGTYQVLVIDDDDTLLALARIALAKHGIEVETAASAADGLARLADRAPDLVVTDILLPDLSGWEVVRRIREATDVHVMVLSGRDTEVDKARGLDLGADDYLTKPFSLLEFEARVRALLRRVRRRERAGERGGAAAPGGGRP